MHTVPSYITEIHERIDALEQRFEVLEVGDKLIAASLGHARDALKSVKPLIEAAGVEVVAQTKLIIELADRITKLEQAAQERA